MPKAANLPKNTAGTPAAEATARGRRVFKISMKGIPPVTPEIRARIEAAARDPAKQRRAYPQISDD